MKGLPMDSPDVEEPYTICLLNKATKIITSPNIFVSKFPPWAYGIEFFNFGNFRDFPSTSGGICYSTS